MRLGFDLDGTVADLQGALARAAGDLFPGGVDPASLPRSVSDDTGQPEANGWEYPEKLGTTTTRIEVFCDDPDAFMARAVKAGANGSLDKIRDHEAPWGKHRQGSFVDPFGHKWMVGDRSPLL